MSNALLNQPIVLLLNQGWQIIGHRTVRQAILSLHGGDVSCPPALGLDIVYPQLADGTWDFENPLGLYPRPWREWIQLPLRDFDSVITTPRLRLRVPTVLVATRFAQLPRYRSRPTREAILARDGGICQYTGERVGRHGGNLDHVIPRARGGPDTFENLVWAKREVNSFKANRLPHEAGLRLRRPPRRPVQLPLWLRLRPARHRDWRHFLPRHPEDAAAP